MRTAYASNHTQNLHNTQHVLLDCLTQLEPASLEILDIMTQHPPTFGQPWPITLDLETTIRVTKELINYIDAVREMAETLTGLTPIPLTEESIETWPL